MSASRLAPLRLLTAASLVLALAAAMFAVGAARPNRAEASAFVTAATANTAADWARSRKGSPYQWGADGPRRFDCSGLTRWAYARVGKWLPHSSTLQARRVERIERRRNARRGDLVFFYDRGGIYHVSIYAGRGYVWTAPYPGTRVRRERIWSSKVFYGRVR